jgi:hypothetical protein
MSAFDISSWCYKRCARTPFRELVLLLRPFTAQIVRSRSPAVCVFRCHLCRRASFLITWDQSLLEPDWAGRQYSIVSNLKVKPSGPYSVFRKSIYTRQLCDSMQVEPSKETYTAPNPRRQILWPRRIVRRLHVVVVHGDRHRNHELAVIPTYQASPRNLILASDEPSLLQCNSTARHIRRHLQHAHVGWCWPIMDKMIEHHSLHDGNLPCVRG